MDEISTEYFSSTNHLFKAFIGDIEKVENSYGESWSGMSSKQKSRLIDEFYKITKDNTGLDSNTEDISEDDDDYYNILKIESGEKVVVDFENDVNGWTWVDENSAPFSWKSKSQQDLRFKDLFGENTSNKNNKIKNKDTSNINDVNKESLSFSKSNKTETNVSSNLESNEIEMMFKKFGLNASNQNEDRLVSGMTKSSETDQKQDLPKSSYQTKSSASKKSVFIAGGLKPAFLDQNVNNDGVFLDANAVNINTRIKSDEENFSICKLEENKEFSNKLTSDFNFFKEDDDKFKLSLGLESASKEDGFKIDFGACVSESSTDNGNFIDKEANRNIPKKENDQKNINSSFQEDSENAAVINLQPKSEVLTVKKTGFDFLDNW